MTQVQMDSIKVIQEVLRKFVAERSWEGFHNPKNLVLALTGEVGELAEHFQWLTQEEAAQIKYSDQKRQAVAYEIVDVLSYLLRLADVLEVDLAEAIRQKIAVNAEKYPVHLSKGVAIKYDKF